jgi:pimeloyl-ACP methyl ester carboxylesterase
MATFVLVAGACCGGWSWRRLTPFLHEAGHAVSTPTLTGLGDRVHLATPAVDLETHIADVVNLLVYEDLRDVTLVGWSSGGMVIPGVADRVPERVSRLIYGDGCVPADGQSEYDLEADPVARRTADLAAAAAAGAPGFWPVPTAYIQDQIPDAAEAAWVLDRLTPHPLAAFAQPLRLRHPAWTGPRAFVYCTEGKHPDGLSTRAAVRLRAAPGWGYREVAANHLAPLTAPQALAAAFGTLV